MQPPVLEFNYDISCPFAYIASTRVKALAERANAKLIYRPVLLGAIYRATNAPQGAGGSASDAFNPTKNAVTAELMKCTIKRYKIQYNPPPQHPRKTVNALRLLYSIDDQEERRILTEALFSAYWVEGADVSDDNILLQVAHSSGINNASALTKETLESATAKSELEKATAEAIERGAFGVPAFWVSEAEYTDFQNKPRKGRYFFGQDRMHFVEATLISLQQSNKDWYSVPQIRSVMPRCMPNNAPTVPTKVQLWFDFSSPWSYLAYTQLARLQRTFPAVEIELKPFLLGVLFREIGVPMVPMSVVSKAKARFNRQDLMDWTDYWNAVSLQEGRKEEVYKFHWTDYFPLKTPTVLKVGIVEPKTTALLYSACWSQNLNMSDESVLSSVLSSAGYNASDLIARAKAKEVSAKLRALTGEAQTLGLNGAPTFRVLRQNVAKKDWELVGGVLWGQDQINVVEDLVAGWDGEEGKAVEGKVRYEEAKGSKL